MPREPVKSGRDLTAQTKAGDERFKKRFENLHERIGEALVMPAQRRLSAMPQPAKSKGKRPVESLAVPPSRWR